MCSSIGAPTNLDIYLAASSKRFKYPFVDSTRLFYVTPINFDKDLIARLTVMVQMFVQNMEFPKEYANHSLVTVSVLMLMVAYLKGAPTITGMSIKGLSSFPPYFLYFSNTFYFRFTLL